MSLVDADKLREIAELEFADIVVESFVSGINELRIILVYNSFVDVWYSLKLPDRYSYHWERRAIDGKIFRDDNAPHKKWEKVNTFPRHFHNGSEDQVVESFLSDVTPEYSLREFLTFVRKKLSK